MARSVWQHPILLGLFVCVFVFFNRGVCVRIEKCQLSSEQRSRSVLCFTSIDIAFQMKQMKM